VNSAFLTGDFGPLQPLTPWQIWGPTGAGIHCDFGICGPAIPGFEAGVDVLEQTAPWVIRVVSVCALTPVCQEAVVPAVAGAVAGYLIYSGIQAGIQIYQARSKPSGKEKATDAPSWAAYYPRGPNEGCGAYAGRILIEKYGAGDPRAMFRGPGSEYSKIKKACERGGL
jgi:hypothetical protein